MLELRTLGTADLRVRGGAELTALVQQPKRFALLVYLTLGTVQKSDATGQIVAVSEETVRFPLPVSARIIGLKSQS